MLSWGEKCVLLYYLAANVLLLLVMGWDKLSAIRGWRRVPEKRLWLGGLLAGGLGGLLGMAAFHHKTRKPVFWMVFTGSFFLHICGWFALCRIFFF